jgi:hypothetical protein
MIWVWVNNCVLKVRTEVDVLWVDVVTFRFDVHSLSYRVCQFTRMLQQLCF